VTRPVRLVLPRDGGRGGALACAAGVTLAMSVALTGCDDDPGRTNFEYMPDMVGSVAYDSFDPNPNTPDGRTLMKPPAGTVPRGYQPLHFGPGPVEAARAGRELANPLPDVEPVRARGAVAFARWCSPCHGPEGLGDGLVARKFPRPPALGADHARALPDGQLFHIITFGQGVMPAYGQQVASSDRWKIVRHLRQLQAGSARPAAVLGVPAAPTAAAAGTAAAVPATTSPAPTTTSPAPAPAQGAPLIPPGVSR
jgi:mono/diheme cytochrome c family protein